MSSITDKIKEVGLKNTIVGLFKLMKYRQLQKKYQFYEWNTSPFELREYVQVAAEYINRIKPKTVIDIGCGLGELLRHIRAEHKVGLDLDENNIKTAKILDRSGKIRFITGSFEQIKGEKIDVLVTLNFMHGLSEDKWIPIYRNFLKSNDVERLIVDTLPQGNGNYHLDFTRILPKEYAIKEDKGPYLSGRHLLLFERRVNHL